MMDEKSIENIQKQFGANIRQACLKHRHLASQYKFGMQVDMILTDENHRVLYGEIPKCASSILKKLMVITSQGSHFSGLTKFPDFSLTFPVFLAIFQYFFNVLFF